MHEKEASALSIEIHGRPVLTYQYGPSWALPHIYPLLSPSGKPLTVQRTEPYPHHRSLWIADHVQLEGGPAVDYYHEWKNLRDRKRPELGHESFIRHLRFLALDDDPRRATVVAELVWIAKGTEVLAETRRLAVEDLGKGEYLLDLSWQLRAEFGDVRFRSDWVHYGWPYVRMNPVFSGAQGGRIEDDQGRRGQKATNGKYARWVDYSNEVCGVTEGLAVFLPPSDKPCKWLTREYGTFGPRRPDAFSGTRFLLKRGATLEGRVGILVHRGDVRGGRVAQRYREFARSLSSPGRR